MAGRDREKMAIETLDLIGYYFGVRKTFTYKCLFPLVHFYLQPGN